jgi:hypothetical protein
MFTKLAQFLLLGVGCARHAQATLGYRADNHPDRRLIANSHRGRRPTLICGWRKIPSSGALECHWRALDPPEVDEVAQWRFGTGIQSPTSASATGKPPFARAAA